MISFVNEKELDQTIISELLYQTDLEKICSDLIREGHMNQQVVFTDLFKEGLKKNNGMEEVESLHVFLADLINKYKEFLAYLDQNKGYLNHEDTKEIIEGIAKIFEDDIAGFSNIKVTEIEDEKNHIIENGSRILIKQFQIAKEAHDKILLEGIIDQVYVHQTLRNAIDRLTEETIDLSVNVMNTVFSHINSLEKRPILNKYVSFLHRQDKTLAMLRLIQMDVIQHEITDLHELDIIKYLDVMIGEIYQLIAKKMKSITAVLEGIAVSPMGSKSISYLREKYRSHMNKQVIESDVLSQSIGIYLNKRDLLLKNLYIKITDEMEKSKGLCLLNLQKENRDIQLLSCKVTEIFKKLSQNLNRMESYIDEQADFKEIALRLIETIQLKYDTLREKDYDYMLDKNTDMLQKEKKLFEYVNDMKENFSDYFFKMVYESDKVFLRIQKDCNLTYDDFIKDVRKKDMDYLKLNLLFELVTFEDIINHSIKKLLTFDHRVPKQMATLINKSYEDILTVLGRFNVDMIEATAGQRFNGKLHEVTIVEEDEQYKKGQIIRMESRGYIYKDVTLLRAHVIVAK